MQRNDLFVRDISQILAYFRLSLARLRHVLAGGMMLGQSIYYWRAFVKLLRNITDKDIRGTDSVSYANPRTAVRAILFDDTDHMALMYMGKYNLYTIPGGGVEASEDFVSALRREMLEETGCKIAITGEIGYIEESRVEHNFTQISYYYLGKVVGIKGAPHMTDAENDVETHVQWHTPEKALDLITNEAPRTYQQKYIQLRDIVVIREVLESLRTI